MFNYAMTDRDAVLIPAYGTVTMLLMRRQAQPIWDRGGGNEILSIVHVRDPDGDYSDTVLFDTDVNACYEETINRFSHRWNIEMAKRKANNPLGSADPQCRCETSVSGATVMAYRSYCLVTLWFPDQFRTEKDFLFRGVPWYHNRITFSDMLAVARRSRLSRGFLVRRSTGQDKPKINFARHDPSDRQEMAKLQ